MRKVGPTGVRRSDGPCCVGIAVAQAQLAMALRPSGERWAVPNDASGGATRVDRGPPLHPTLRVREATGGLERAATSAWAAAGLPVVVVHPRQARAVARATGPWAQTAALEARARAPCAAVIRPLPRPRPDAQPQERRALLGRRQPLIVMRTAAPPRLAGTRARLTPALAAPMTWLKADSATRDDARETRLRASPRWRATDAVWQSAQGLGPVCAHTWLRALPAWGTRTRQPIAALVGVAPRHGASGTLRGRRTRWGGRAPVRTVLSMGTLVATRFHPPSKVCYERLLAAGNVKKVALTACMHKCLTILNAMLKPRTPWQPQEVQN
jgi:transposase